MKFKIFLTILLLVSVMSAFAFASDNIKKPNVSGTFYDADAGKLKAEIARYFKAAGVTPVQGQVGLIIVPHAGYVYSGPVAAHSFKAASAGKYATVVILAPSHYYPFQGVSVWPKGGFQTPLGTARIDEELAAALLDAGDEFYFDPRYYEREHSVEVEIPFIQYTFPEAKIVPVLVGRMNGDEILKFAGVLNRVIGRRTDVLVAVSTDMSHYHDDKTARRLDLAALKNIQSLDIERIVKGQEEGETEIDGFIPVLAAALYARERGLKPVFGYYANSGDVTGERERVVGYNSVVFARADTGGAVLEPESEDKETPLNDEQKKRLLEIARQTIEAYVRDGKKLEFAEKDKRLHATEGAFVTLRKGPRKQLRGCIGHIVSDQPLYRTVRDMAIASATQDPRFTALTEEELADVDVEVSVLSVPRRVKSADEIELGKHGVIIGEGYKRGLFLPQVAEETGWSKEQFLSELCSQKAGLSPDAWKDPATKIEVFTADVFDESE